MHWASKGVFEGGLCWRVVSGHKISINDDAWIPNNGDYCLQSVVNSMHGKHVFDLIKLRSKR